MSPSPTVAIQFEILHSGADPATWALAQLGLPEEWRDTNLPGNTVRCQEAVDRLFTLSRAELEGEIASRGLVAEDLGQVLREPGSRDGHYFIDRRGCWETYYQEREGRWAEAVFEDLTEARKFLINLWLPVWLKRLRLPCRTRGGALITQL